MPSAPFYSSDRKLIKLSPGPIPEVKQLAGLSRGLAEVRQLIVRETAGAIMPRNQLLAVDSMMQMHHDAIAKVMSGAKRNSGVLSPLDTFQLIGSVAEHITMASYWLQIAKPMSRLPGDLPNRRDVSEVQSRQKRLGVLSKMDSDWEMARRLIGELSQLAPGNLQVERVFGAMNFEMFCVRVNSVIAAYYSASGGPRLSDDELKGMLSELDQIRLSPTFPKRSSEEKQNLWLSAGLIYETLGDRENVKRALRERYTLIDDPDGKSRLLIEMLSYSDEAENDLQVMNELRSLSRRADAGVEFSRDRIGRVSIMRDAFWSTAVKADLASPVGQAVFEDCFACYDDWVFRRAVEPFSRLVRVFTDWAGNGKVAWSVGKDWNSSYFTMEPEIATRLLIATENSTLAEEKRVLQKAVVFLDSSLAAALADAFDVDDEWRIHGVGLVGALPLLATSISGHRLGSNSKIAYRHPNPTVGRLSASRIDAPELLILDTCFAMQSQKVKAAYERSIKVSGIGRIIQFNSNHPDRALSAQVLAAELQSVSSAIIFSHVESPVAYAYEAGIVLGPSSRFKLSELASLRLANLEELAIVGCASGRNNPFVGEATPAHAAAIAGASEIMFTLWPIRPSNGSRVVKRMLESRLAGITMRDAIAKQFEANFLDALPFAIMRP